VIEVRSLTKSYGDTTAVRELSFRVEPGRVTGFLGPNGAGKSTTMRMILGLDRPSSGAALVDGRPYAGLDRPLTRVGALLDAHAVHGGRTARGHLLWLARSNGLPDTRVDAVLAQVGLADVAKRRIRGFSLGMRQRLGVAAALLGDPDVLLLDEPVNGLDPEGIRWIRTLLRKLAAEGKAVLVSSHLMTEMALTADHLVVIGRGRLLADLSTADFLEQHGRTRVRVRAVDADKLTALVRSAGLAGEPAGDGAWELTGVDAEQVGALAADHRVALLELSVRQDSLEEAFMTMTAADVEYRAVAA